MPSFVPPAIRRCRALPLLLLLVAAEALGAGAPRAILAPGDFAVADHAGKVLVVDFWASWCKPCGTSLPWLSQLAAAHAAEGLVVVAVNLDEDLGKAQKQLAALDPAVVVVHDPEGVLAERYALEGMPSAFIYDRQGKLRDRHVGFVPAEAAAREAVILGLLHEEVADHAP